MSRVEGYPTLGIVPLQDQREDVDPHKRAAMLAGRVVARDPRTSNFCIAGKTGADDQPNSVGDVGLGSTLWPNDPAGRPIPAWFLAAPAVTDQPLGDPGQGTQTGPPQAKLRPAGTDRFGPDTRFDVLGASAAPGVRLPTGWPVLVVGATQERAQVPLAFPSAGPLVAVHAAGDPSAASLVADLDPESRVDPARMARLHTLARVALPQGGIGLGTTPALAWQLGAAGRDGRTGNGLVSGRGGGQEPPPRALAPTPTSAGPQPATGGTIARPPAPTSGGTQAGRPGGPGGTQTRPQDGGGGTRAPSQVLALAGRPFGPLDVGGATDVHRCGVTADGEPVNELHVSTEAKFRDPGGGRDGPLEFQPAVHVQPAALPMLTRAHLRYDPTVPHGWAGGTAPGLWRLSAETTAAILPPEIDDTADPPPGDPKDLDPRPEPPPSGRPLTGGPGGSLIGTVGGGGIPVPPTTPPPPPPVRPLTGGASSETTTTADAPRPVTGGYPVEPLCKIQAGNLWIGALVAAGAAKGSLTSAAKFAEALLARGETRTLADLADTPAPVQFAGYAQGSSSGTFSDAAPSENNANVGGPATATGGVLLLPGDVDPAALLAGEDVESQHDPAQLGFTDALAELGFGTPDAETGRMVDGATIGSEAGTLSVTMTDADGAPDGQTNFKPGGEISMDAALEVAEISTPATPSTGHAKIYPKSDGQWYGLDDAGTETQLGGGAAAPITVNADVLPLVDVTSASSFPISDMNLATIGKPAIASSLVGGATDVSAVYFSPQQSAGPITELVYLAAFSVNGTQSTSNVFTFGFTFRVPANFASWQSSAIEVRHNIWWPFGTYTSGTTRIAVEVFDVQTDSSGFPASLGSANRSQSYPSADTSLQSLTIADSVLSAIGAGDMIGIKVTIDQSAANDAPLRCSIAGINFHMNP